ncbi:MAG: hypothetical protein Q9217_001586 [Psora testacea]
MQDYSKFTVAKLKEELDRRGLPKSGLKAALVQRLDEADAQSQREGVVARPREDKGDEIAKDCKDSKAKDDFAPTAKAKKDDEAVHGAVGNDEATTQQPQNTEDASLSRQHKANGTVGHETATTEATAHENAILSEPDLVNNSTAGEVTIPQPKFNGLPDNSTQPDYNEGILETQLPTPAHTQSEQLAVADAFPSMSTQTSITREEIAEDSRKRKRRSQSPPPSSLDNSKRLKGNDAADTRPAVKLPEDTTSEDMPTTSKQRLLSCETHTNGGSEAQDKAVTANVPVVHPAQTTPEASPPLRSGSVTPTSSKPPHAQLKQSPSDRRFRPLAAPTSEIASPPPSQYTLTDRDIPPALHPATSALYIRNLMRPLNPATFKAHLTALARSSTSSAADNGDIGDIITHFHIDTIRTHALIRLTSITAAARVRASLHDRVWPNERDRKPLWVDFVPEEKLREWIEVENEQSGGRGSTGKRWEVVYETGNGEVKAFLQEVGKAPSRPQAVVAVTTSKAPITTMPTPTPIGQPKPAESKEFKALDDLFSSTSAKPKVYFLPVNKSVADKRLDLLDEGRGGGRSDEMRRFSFEDGIIVDKGPEYGRGGRGGFGGRGRGDGGYGGYRGRGGGGPAYRGGGDGWRDRRRGY